MYIRLTNRTALTLSLLICCILAACGDSSSNTGSSSTTQSSTHSEQTSSTSSTDTSTQLPSNVFATEYAVNIVDAEAAQTVQTFLAAQNPNLDLIPAVRAFYTLYPDVFDFLYFLTPKRLEDAVAGRFLPVRRPINPALGFSRPTRDDTADYALKLKALVAFNTNSSGNGPTLHETAHYWGVYLDESFGFGIEQNRDWGAHWGIAGLHGQLGGFDPDTLTCADDGDTLPCQAREDGRVYVSVERFGPNQNGGDSLPYAPIELYLMGLLPASEVPSPIPILQDATLVEDLRDQNRMIWSASNIQYVPFQEILDAQGGERDLIPDTDRAFRGAMIVFSEFPLSREELETADNWARVFEGERSSFVLSFEDATGGRATMEMKLPSLKISE